MLLREREWGEYLDDAQKRFKECYCVTYCIVGDDVEGEREEVEV